MPLGSSTSTVQTDLHKYFKTQKSSLYSKDKNSKPLNTKFLDGSDGSSKLNKNVKFKKLSQLEIGIKSENEEPTETFTSTTIKANTLATLSITPIRKGKELNKTRPITKKRKQEQVADLENGENFTKIKSSDSAKKKLKLDSTFVQKNSEETFVVKKLNPDDVKKELSKCAHIDELRSRLQKLHKCEEKFKEIKRLRDVSSNKQNLTNSSQNVLKTPKKCFLKAAESSNEVIGQLSNDIPLSPYKISHTLPKLGIFKSIDVEVPISPSKSPLKLASPMKSFHGSPTICHPSYQRSLELDSANQLPLPFKYQSIKEVFRAVDTIVSLRHNRQEMITFSKLKFDVCEMIRKSFTEHNLGQLKTVFPLAYFFKQEKVIRRDPGSYNVPSYQLIIQPNLNYKESVSKNLMERFDSSKNITSNKFRKMDSVVLVERRKIFHDSLLEIIQRHHAEFLKNLDPPIMLTKPVNRWHEDFPLNDIALPDASPLPSSPEDNTPKTAQLVMEKAMDIFSVNNRMKAAIEKVSASSVNRNVSSIVDMQPQQQSITNPKVAAALKGVSLSLLEKIRAREKEKAVRDMCRSGKDNRELEMLSRLPQLACNIRSIFVSVKKATLLWDEMIIHISRCEKNTIPRSEIEEHLKLLLNLLQKEIPNWCVLINIRNENRLKLVDKERNVSDITNLLNKIIKEKA